MGWVSGKSWRQEPAGPVCHLGRGRDTCCAGQAWGGVDVLRRGGVDSDVGAAHRDSAICLCQVVSASREPTGTLWGGDDCDARGGGGRYVAERVQLRRSGRVAARELFERFGGVERGVRQGGVHQAEGILKAADDGGLS